MKVLLTRGVLDVLSKLAAEGVSADELEEKFKVVRLTAKGGVLSFESRSVDAEVLSWSRDVQIEQEGSVQIDFAKFAQLVSQVNVSAEIFVTGAECRIVSGSATWRLKIHNFDLSPVLPEGFALKQWTGEVLRTETLKDVLIRAKGVIPVEADLSLDSVRMVALDEQTGYATDRVRVVGVDFAPSVSKPISFSRRMVYMLLRFISVTGEANVTVVDEGDFYSFVFGQSYIKSKKLALQFPVQQVKTLFVQPVKPWFDVRLADLVDGLKKAVITSEYGEPRVQFASSGDVSLELTSEDMLGNRGHVVIPATVSEQHSAVIRAELIRALIDGARGERISVSLCEGKFIKLCSEGVVGILMTMPAMTKGKPSGTGAKPTKAAPKKDVGVGAVEGSPESNE